MSQSVKVGQLMYVPGSIVVLKLELLHKSKPDFLNAICKMERGESIAIVMFTFERTKKIPILSQEKMVLMYFFIFKLSNYYYLPIYFSIY